VLHAPRFRSVVLSFVVATLVGCGVASAQATRTWVSGVGDDANPCSRTAPCKTFAGAISKTAADGEIDAIDAGGFGAVTITKSITIDGGGTHAAILAAGTNGVNVNGAGIVVTLRNLSINGAGTGLIGVSITNALAVYIENCTIANFNAGTARGISMTVAANLVVTNSSIRNNGTASGGAGIHVQNGRATIENTVIEGNMDGLSVATPAIASVRRSSASGSGNCGFISNGADAVINLEDSTATHNAYGVAAVLGATIRFSDVGILSNVQIGVYNDGISFLVSYGNNRIIGNANNGAFTSTIVLK